MAELIAASSLRSNKLGNLSNKIQKFNEKLTRHLENYPDETKLLLYFDEWGYEWSDIQFIEDAGYEITRNRHCQWWEVRW